ncbi:hypothetical protein HYPSUDRAFT_215805 [Hypholoma sublateritium FD-334 SS-4]|uniref:Uncharacterized protein n=1 Tax=Hypholoma sublateritium (strain FD-334 SS-4) TaxID=945553 RepID=A0A0D2NU72_HYPSF|nr:hypothetical protein HYPSUDRAFT_215805 [Hypholoma sublateritium FD-334 SS-4]
MHDSASCNRGRVEHLHGRAGVKYAAQFKKLDYAWGWTHAGADDGDEDIEGSMRCESPRKQRWRRVLRPQSKVVFRRLRVITGGFLVRLRSVKSQALLSVTTVSIQMRAWDVAPRVGTGIGGIDTAQRVSTVAATGAGNSTQTPRMVVTDVEDDVKSIDAYIDFDHNISMFACQVAAHYVKTDDTSSSGPSGSQNTDKMCSRYFTDSTKLQDVIYQGKSNLGSRDHAIESDNSSPIKIAAIPT